MAQANQLAIVQINNASALVKTGNFRGAEAALQEIASAEGDKALTKALTMVPPADLSQILVGTATQPSAICSGLVTPETFVKALLEVPNTWEPGYEEEALLQLQELFCGVVMRPDGEGYAGYHATKFFKEIYKNQEATELLAFYLNDKVVVASASSKPKKVAVLETTDGEDEDDDNEDGNNNDVEVPDDEDEVERKTLAFHPCLTDKDYEPQEGDWDHLASLTRKVPDLLGSLKMLWINGIVYESFLPSVTKKARKSALWGTKVESVFGRLFIQGIDIFDVLKEEFNSFLYYYYYDQKYPRSQR